LEGVRNCLDVGAQHFITEAGDNQFALVTEECGGLDIIEKLQEHQNQHIYEISVEIIESFFQLEEVNFDDEGNDNSGASGLIF